MATPTFSMTAYCNKWQPNMQSSRSWRDMKLDSSGENNANPGNVAINIYANKWPLLTYLVDLCLGSFGMMIKTSQTLVDYVS